jgi:hypothetical protein
LDARHALPRTIVMKNVRVSITPPHDSSDVSQKYTVTCTGPACTVKPAKKKGKDPTDEALHAPTGLKSSAVTVDGASLKWANGKGSTMAQIAIAYHSGGPYIYKGSTKKGTWTLTGLKPSTDYYVKVFHTKDKHDSSKAATTKFTTKSSTPRNPMVVNVGSTGFRVNWESAWAGNAGFAASMTAVYLAYSPSGPWTYWGASIGGQRYFEVGGLTPNTSYWVRVQDMSGPSTQPRYSAAAKTEATTLPG